MLPHRSCDGRLVLAKLPEVRNHVMNHNIQGQSKPFPTENANARNYIYTTKSKLHMKEEKRLQN